MELRWIFTSPVDTLVTSMNDLLCETCEPPTELVALVTGKATAKSLYQHGQLKVDGDVSVAHRLGFLNKLI